MQKSGQKLRVLAAMWMDSGNRVRNCNSHQECETRLLVLSLYSETLSGLDLERETGMGISGSHGGKLEAPTEQK